MELTHCNRCNRSNPAVGSIWQDQGDLLKHLDEHNYDLIVGQNIPAEAIVNQTSAYSKQHHAWIVTECQVCYLRKWQAFDFIYARLAKIFNLGS